MEFIDISLPISEELPVWPGDPAIELVRISSIKAGDNANVSKLSCGVHVGTHVDAPLHFLEDGKTITDLSFEALIGPAQVVEFPAASVIDEAVLKGSEIAIDAERILFKTRNSYYWGSGESEFNENFVAVDESGARWLVDHGVKLVGVDYLSVAPWNESRPTHEVLLEAEVVILEGLNLHDVRPGHYDLTCLPIKLSDCDGAPARAVLSREN